MNILLRDLFAYKAAADDELLTRLAGLGTDARIPPLAIQALSHTYVVDQIFAAHMKGETHGFTSANLTQQPTLSELSKHLRASDAQYVAYISGLSASQLAERIDFSFTDGALGRMSREEMLMHVITHGVGHRGQISALMLLNSEKPAKDGFTTYLHEAQRAIRRRVA